MTRLTACANLQKTFDITGAAKHWQNLFCLMSVGELVAICLAVLKLELMHQLHMIFSLSESLLFQYSQDGL